MAPDRLDQWYREQLVLASHKLQKINNLCVRTVPSAGAVLTVVRSLAML
jgi:hypothetical protein